MLASDNKEQLGLRLSFESNVKRLKRVSCSCKDIDIYHFMDQFLSRL